MAKWVMRQLSPNMLGVSFALIAYALFVAGDSFYKYLGTTYEIYQIAFFGKLFAAIAIFGFILFTKQKIKTNFLKLQIIRSLALTTNFLCILYAYRYMTLAEVALMYYLCPFITSILSKFLLKEPVGIHRIISIIVGFTGILVVLRPGLIDLNPATFVLLTGVIAFSFANILSRKIGPSEPAINFTLFPTLMSTLCVLPLVTLNPVVPSFIDTSFMAAGGIIGSIAILMISVAYVKTHAVTVSILAYTDIFWALLLGYIIFGDVTNDPLIYLGGVIIMLSGAYLIYRENKVTK